MSVNSKDPIFDTKAPGMNRNTVAEISEMPIVNIQNNYFRNFFPPKAKKIIARYIALHGSVHKMEIEEHKRSRATRSQNWRLIKSLF